MSFHFNGLLILHLQFIVSVLFVQDTHASLSMFQNRVFEVDVARLGSGGEVTEDSRWEQREYLGQ